MYRTITNPKETKAIGIEITQEGPGQLQNKLFIRNNLHLNIYVYIYM